MEVQKQTVDFSEQTSELFSALAEAQAQFPTIKASKKVEVKTRDGRAYEYSYAPINTIIEQISPALKKAGLAVMSFPGKGELTTVLTHKSGQWAKSTIPLVFGSGGMQAIGSAITYARRYNMVSLLNIAIEGEDDDGVATTTQPAQNGAKDEKLPPFMPEDFKKHEALIKGYMNKGESVEDIITRLTKHRYSGVHPKAIEAIEALAESLPKKKSKTEKQEA